MNKRKQNTYKQNPGIYNPNKEKNIKLSNELKPETLNKNEIKSQQKLEKYMKKNLSSLNFKKEKIEENIQQTNKLNENKIKNKKHILSKHSSMKYFKITPIINPLHDRAYFTSKINLQTANNINKHNIDLNRIIKNINLEDSPTTTRQTQTLNKIQNMPIHIMNNINIINNNLVGGNHIKNGNIIFMKKRIPSCNKTSLSKQKNKKNNNIESEEAYSIYIKKNERFNTKEEKAYDNYKFKNHKQNMFNKANIRKTKPNINNINDNDANKNFNISFKNTKYNNNNINKKIDYLIENNYNTTNYNNHNDFLDFNERDQTNFIPIKELNLEDFLLIIQKLDDIINNIKYIYSFYNLNLEQNYISAKKILKLNNVNRVKLYDLFLFYMGSSFDGSPEKLFQDKKMKYYLHIWTVIFILSIGILFTVAENVNLIDECSQDILKLISLQEKLFLIFCDLTIQKLNKQYKYNIWVGQILEKLRTRQIINISNHITLIRTLIINSYEIINNLLLAIKNFDNHQNTNIKDNSKFLYNNFYNADWKYLNEIIINEMEESFNQHIFKSFNTNTKYTETETYKNSTIKYNFSRDYYSNMKLDINKNNSPENTINNKILNLSKNNQKIILKNSNSNPLLIKKNNNINIIPKNNYSKSSIIRYDITIPDGPCPSHNPTIPFLNFSSQKPYTLVIDLDETMASFKFTNEKKGIGVLYLRPNLENFLEVIKDYYEIIPFTSASRDYADIALDLIEKGERKKYFEKRLYREHTTPFETKYIKDLTKLGRDLSKVIIVDNLSQCFKLNTENGILISSFFGEDEDDKTLIELQKVLIKIYYDKDDVRKSLIKYKGDIFNKISKNLDE